MDDKHSALYDVSKTFRRIWGDYKDFPDALDAFEKTFLKDQYDRFVSFAGDLKMTEKQKEFLDRCEKKITRLIEKEKNDFKKKEEGCERCGNSGWYWPKACESIRTEDGRFRTVSDSWVVRCSCLGGPEKLAFELRKIGSFETARKVLEQGVD